MDLLVLTSWLWIGATQQVCHAAFDWMAVWQYPSRQRKEQ